MPLFISPYVFNFDFQCALHIRLVHMAIDPFNIATWHTFCSSLLNVFFFMQGGKKGHQEICTHPHSRRLGDIVGRHTIKAYALAS
jgi:hypothetical protein